MNKFHSMLMSFLGGIGICCLISVVLSIFRGDGLYYIVHPEFVKSMGSELNAVILQYILSGCLGVVSCLISFVWNIESWTIIKKTFFHFTVMFIVFLLVAYINYWIKHDLISVLQVLIWYAGFYFVFWVFMYLYNTHKMKIINSKLEQIKNSSRK